MKNKKLISLIALVAFVMSFCIIPNVAYASSYGSENKIVNKDKNVKEKIGEFSETIDGVTFTYDYKEKFRTVTIQYPDGKIDKVTYDVEKKETKLNDKLINFKDEVKVKKVLNDDVTTSAVWRYLSTEYETYYWQGMVVSTICAVVAASLGLLAGEVKDNMVDKYVIFTMGLTFVAMSTVVAYNAPNAETVNYYYYDAYNESHLLHNQYMYVNDEQIGDVFVYETW